MSEGGKIVGEGSGKMGEDGKGEGSGEGKVVGDGNGETGEDCKVVVGKFSILWGVGGQRRIHQHEGVKECGKKFIETPIPTNVGHNYGLANISSKNNRSIGNSHSPDKGQLESGGGVQQG